MYFLVFCLVLINTQNITSAKKVYVIDLAHNEHNEDRVELTELFKLLTKSKETPYEKANFYRTLKNRATNDENCLMDVTITKIEKIKCLQKIQRNTDNIRNYSYRDFYKQKPKRKIYDLYNYYGGLLETQPFTDLTRQEFSQDYLDIGDLSRHLKCADCNQSWEDEIDKRKDSELKVMRRDTKDDRGTSSESNDSSDSSEERRSEEDKTSEEEIKNVRTNKKRRKRNRFQVVFNEDSSIETEKVKKKKPKSFSESEDAEKESRSDSEEVTKPRKSRDKYAYLQGNRVYDFRRRLEHFLPKRYHWDEEDMHNLGYYWFDGPKGKYTQH